jgi:DNA-binding Xre family transcriptional regulator
MLALFLKKIFINMINLRVKQVMQLRGLKPTVKYLEAIGIGRGTANTMLYDNPKSILFSDLLQLCIVLHCTPKDILEISLPPNEVLMPGHPLLQWLNIKLPSPANYLNQLSHEQLQAVEVFVKKMALDNMADDQNKLDADNSTLGGNNT